MRKARLFTPGPTPLIPEAQIAGAMPLVHHRTPAFRDLLLSTRRNLQTIFKTTYDLVILAASGTGAMEAVVSNLHSPGDQVIPIVAGKFGARWAELARAFGLDCVPLTKEYGQAASAEELLALLHRHPKVVSVLLQGCETSTATAHDLESIGRRVSEAFPEVLLIVDGITAVGSQDVRPDEWGLDVVISGSQKAFGVPPGLSFMSLSPKAVQRLETGQPTPHYYWNLGQEVQGQATGSTVYTPAISLVTALHAATERMLGEGVDSIIAAAEEMARATRTGLRALGFHLLSASPANALTAAFPPEGIQADSLRRELEAHYGIQVAGGQGEVRGKIIRIAHLGYFDILDMFTILTAIELCLVRTGRWAGAGSGVCAAFKEVQRACPPGGRASWQTTYSSEPMETSHENIDQ